MPRKKQTTPSQSLLDWCNEQSAAGRELAIKWDGGDDSGWAHFQLDGEDFNNEHADLLVDKMYDELNYGSWAGDFSASGTATYNPETQSFEGTDYYSERESMDYDANIEIRIPKNLWFDNLTIQIELTVDTENIEVNFNIKNGFFTPQHELIETEIEEKLQKEVNSCIEKFSEEHPDQFDAVWDSHSFEREDFTEDGDYMVITIETVDIRYNQVRENEIVLSVEKLQEQIAE